MWIILNLDNVTVFKNSQVIKLTMSGGGVKIKWWIDKMGSIFSEVLWFKGILPLWSNNMFVMMCNRSEPFKMRASIVSHNTYCDYKAKLDWEADTFFNNRSYLLHQHKNVPRP